MPISPPVFQPPPGRLSTRHVAMVRPPAHTMRDIISMLTGLLPRYQGVLARRPILTQCITTGILMATGDTIAQQGIEKNGKDHDFLRTARMASYGTGETHQPAALTHQKQD